MGLRDTIGNKVAATLIGQPSFVELCEHIFTATANCQADAAEACGTVTASRLLAVGPVLMHLVQELLKPAGLKTADLTLEETITTLNETHLTLYMPLSSTQFQELALRLVQLAAYKYQSGMARRYGFALAAANLLYLMFNSSTATMPILRVVLIIGFLPCFLLGPLIALIVVQVMDSIKAATKHFCRVSDGSDQPSCRPCKSLCSVLRSRCNKSSLDLSTRKAQLKQVLALKHVSISDLQPLYAVLQGDELDAELLSAHDSAANKDSLIPALTAPASPKLQADSATPAARLTAGSTIKLPSELTADQSLHAKDASGLVEGDSPKHGSFLHSLRGLLSIRKRTKHSQHTKSRDLVHAKYPAISTDATYDTLPKIQNNSAPNSTSVQSPFCAKTSSPKHTSSERTLRALTNTQESRSTARQSQDTRVLQLQDSQPTSPLCGSSQQNGAVPGGRSICSAPQLPLPQGNSMPSSPVPQPSPCPTQPAVRTQPVMLSPFQQYAHQPLFTDTPPVPQSARVSPSQPVQASDVASHAGCGCVRSSACSTISADDSASALHAHAFSSSPRKGNTNSSLERAVSTDDLSGCCPGLLKRKPGHRNWSSTALQQERPGNVRSAANKNVKRRWRFWSKGHTQYQS